jgi:hypothetical protein
MDAGREASPEGVEGAADGAAPPPPTVIASGRTKPTGIATDGISLYWTEAGDQGQILRCPLAGCEGDPSVVVDNESAPTDLVAGKLGIGWTAVGAGQLRFQAPDAGAANCGRVEAVSALRHRGGFLFVFEDNGVVESCAENAGCSPCDPQVAHAPGPLNGDVDAKYVYFTTNSDIRRCPMANFCDVARPQPGGGWEMVRPSVANVGDLVVDDLSVYWVDSVAGSVLMAPKDPAFASTKAKTLLSNEKHPSRLVVDQSDVYVLSRGDGADGEVVRVSTSNGERTVLASGLAVPSHLLVEAANVYFTTLGAGSGMGSILRVPKH